MEDAKELKLDDILGPLEEEMEFFFSSFLGTSYPSIYRKELCWKPHTDVYETEQEYVVTMELAQMKPEEVSITFQEGVLLIRGVRKAAPPSERRRYHKMEIHYGPFERKISINEEVDINGLRASYNDGFLEIILPRRTSPSSNTVNIEVE